MNFGWHRYTILSSAFEASRLYLGFADAGLMGIIAASLAAMGFFASTQQWLTATLLLAPIVLAWRGVMKTGELRPPREIGTLLDPHATDRRIRKSLTELARAYEVNEVVVGDKARALNGAGLLFLGLIAAGLASQLLIPLLPMLTRILCYPRGAC